MNVVMELDVLGVDDLIGPAQGSQGVRILGPARNKGKQSSWSRTRVVVLSLSLQLQPEGARQQQPLAELWEGLGEPENTSKTAPKADTAKTEKRSGAARAKGPKTHQKRRRRRTENGASESGKKSALAELSHSLGGPETVPKRPPKGTQPKQGNAAARRAQNGQKRTKNDAGGGPKTGRLNPVRKSLWQSFATATDKGRRARRQAWATPEGCRAIEGKPRQPPKRFPKPAPQNAQTQRHGARRRTKNAPKTRPSADRKRCV